MARRESVRCRARLGALDGAKAAPETGKLPAYEPLTDLGGWFEARFECSSKTKRCPVPVIVTPYGRIVSPWSPEFARASASRVALTRTSTGRYVTLLVGGDPGAEGKLTLLVHDQAYSRSFTHSGVVTTAVESDVLW